MNRFRLMILSLALLLSGAVYAAHGSFERGYVAPGNPVTWSDYNRGAQLASRMVQDVLALLFRSAAGTPAAVCDDGGFVASAGTGFNINVAAGTCFYPLATSNAYSSSYAVLKLRTAEAVTAWTANPVSAGTVVYYVHARPGVSVSGGMEVADPSYLVNTAASAAGYLTVASVSIDSTDANAAAYTYTDLRDVANGTSFAPGDLELGGDIDAAGTVHGVTGIMVGPQVAPTGEIAADGAFRLGTAAAPVFTVSTGGATHSEGALTLGPVAAPTAQIAVDGSQRWGTSGAPVATMGATGAFDALTISTGGGTAVDVSAFFDDIAAGGSGLATANLGAVTDGAGGVSWGAPIGRPYLDADAAATIAAGVVTGTSSSRLVIDTQGGAGADDLDTISGASYATGAVVWVRSADPGRVVTAKHATGNLQLGGADVALSPFFDLLLRWTGAAWVAVSPHNPSIVGSAVSFANLTALTVNGTLLSGDLAAGTLALTHAADPTGGGADAPLHVAYVDGAWMGALQCVNSTGADAVIATSLGGGAIVEHSAAPAGFAVHVDEAGTAGQRLVVNNTALAADIHVALSDGRILTIHHDAGAGALPAAYFDSNGGTVAQRIVFLSATAASTAHAVNPRRELTPLRP